MAKEIKVRPAGGGTYNTLPGGTGELARSRNQIGDTIFGQSYQSNQPGLKSWNISANALYKGFAGYVATIKQQGASTVFTDEATTNTAGLEYQITDTTKRIWNRAVGITVEDNAVAVAAVDIESIDYLFGKVTFVVGYVPTGAITVTGEYYPTTALGRANGFTLTQTSNLIPTSDFATVQANGGWATFDPGLKIANLELTGIYDETNTFKSLLDAGTEIIVEINPDGNGKSLARGFYKIPDHSQSGEVGALEEESVTLMLTVPDDEVLAIPFGWQHAVDTTLSQSIVDALDAWTNDTKLDAQYFPFGASGAGGEEGRVCVAELTLSGGLEVMNDFSVNLTGDGAIADVP